MRRYLNAKELRDLLGISETTLKRWLILHSDFPRPLRTTSGPSGHRRWIEQEVIDWMASRRDEVA